MVVPILCFFMGVLLCQQWSALPGILLIVAALIVALLMAYLKYWRVALFLLGAVYASGTAHYYLSQQLSPGLQGKALLIQGNIIGLPEYNEQRVRFDFQVTHSQKPLPGKLRISWYYPKQKVRAGQSWQFYVKLKQVHGTLNPGGFDYEKWLFIRHIGATGYIREPDKARLIGVRPAWLSISRLRQKLSDLLAKQSISSESLALIKALTLGDKSQISTQQWQVLQKTGTSHLMAISGLHIGLIAGMVYCLFFQCWLRVPSNKISAPQVGATFAIIAALFYAALAGFSIPTQRAVIMLSVLMFAILARRQVKSLSILSVALLIVLLLDPMTILSEGFYLSFLAVFCIIYVLSSRLGQGHRLKNSLKIHVVIALCLLPIVLFFFQTVSIIAPLANMIAVPVVSFMLVPLSLLALVFLQLLPEIAALLLHTCDMVLQSLWQVLLSLADIPMANIIRPKPLLWQMILAMLGIFLILAPRGVPGRFLGTLLLLPLFLVQPAKPEAGDMFVTLLDVGQGLAVVIETAEHSLVFDTGARFSDRYDMGRNVLLPFLHFRRITNLDKLIISHADNDHIGGAESLLNSISTQQVLSSVPEQLVDYGASRCYAGLSWEWDQVGFQFLSPPAYEFQNENENSCVLKVETVNASVLLTGDIEREAENYLIENASAKLPADVLIAPHHGSKTSSSAAFLAIVQPDIILIPADSPNRFGFPHAEVIERYQEVAAKYMITGKSGAISIKFTKTDIQLDSYREQYSHYWNRRD